MQVSYSSVSVSARQISAPFYYIGQPSSAVRFQHKNAGRVPFPRCPIRTFRLKTRVDSTHCRGEIVPENVARINVTRSHTTHYGPQKNPQQSLQKTAFASAEHRKHLTNGIPDAYNPAHEPDRATTENHNHDPQTNRRSPQMATNTAIT